MGRRVVSLLIAILAMPMAHAEEPVRVFAAASLTNALGDIAKVRRKAGHPAPVISLGASSALAKQIESGAPADVFASADLKWMDYLAEKGKIVPASRRNLLGNSLVLIAPKGKHFTVEMKPEFDFGAAFKGKLCTGEPGVVPVGIYAKQSLEHLGWWKTLSGRIVGTDDVRTALAFVERSECPVGIVYATDAAISSNVEVIAQFPESSHDPIVYPFALVKGARAEAQALLDDLGTAEATAVFERYGFAVLKAEGR
ncbi:MAG TPA: molybdate ABC transporter substrate-binding protein [Nevskiaceae bacterium]|nr:molybdate ABC transporter substrate-binding protein [Nevskiaceae bacterium]